MSSSFCHRSLQFLFLFYLLLFFYSFLGGAVWDTGLKYPEGVTPPARSGDRQHIAAGRERIHVRTLGAGLFGRAQAHRQVLVSMSCVKGKMTVDK